LTIQGYDLVGDIHGHADALQRLLHELGYEVFEDVFRHPERQMIFVGDFIDLGPYQREVLRIARSICGHSERSHRKSRIQRDGWVTRNKDGAFLRNHSPKNTKQHAEFLNQIGESSEAHKDAIDWFRILPVRLELPGFRVIHASHTIPRVRHEDEPMAIRGMGVICTRTSMGRLQSASSLSQPVAAAWTGATECLGEVAV
jgi:calcineurin-like phosphoesterase family protein